MRAKILGVLIALALVLVPAGVAAGNTADVSVTATPEFIGISVNPTTWGPSVPDGGASESTATNYFTITNTSNVLTNQTIGVTSGTWSSTGQDWTHSETGESGEHTVGVWAVLHPGTWADPIGSGETPDEIVVKLNSPLEIVSSHAAATDYDFGLAIIGPTTNVDVDSKTNTIRITATKNPTSKAYSLEGGASLTIDGHGWTYFGG